MTTKEEFKVSGEQLLGKVKEILHEGNVRSITVKGKDGRTIVAFPLTVGVVGAAVAPVLAAIGAVAALVTECSIIVERDEGDTTEKSASTGTSGDASTQPPAGITGTHPAE